MGRCLILRHTEKADKRVRKLIFIIVSKLEGSSLELNSNFELHHSLPKCILIDNVSKLKKSGRSFWHLNSVQLSRSIKERKGTTCTMTSNIYIYL